MAAELLSVLTRRRTRCEAQGAFWESAPKASNADASHFGGLSFTAPSAGEWLKSLGDGPEENELAEAVGESFAARGLRPAHAPAPADEAEASRLEALAKALAEAERLLASERDALGGRCDKVARRESELSEREAALEAERAEQRRCEETRRNYPIPAWLSCDGRMNVAVTGNAGVGKSLLINRLRRIRPGADGWAPVGIEETTMTPTAYEFPGEPRVRLWDLPGAGTEAFPLETYIQTMGLRYFDRVIIVSAGRFTSTEVALKAELERKGVPYVMVRTKVDIDVANNLEDNRLAEADTIAQMLAAFRSNGIDRAFLVSLREPDRFEFPSLIQDLFPGSAPRALNPGAANFHLETAAWSDAWAMPVAHSDSLACMQGRWIDAHQCVYFIQGLDVHVTLNQGGCAVVCMTQAQDCVWWVGRWWCNRSKVLRAHSGTQLIWAPAKEGDQPLVWWLMD